MQNIQEYTAVAAAAAAAGAIATAVASPRQKCNAYTQFLYLHITCRKFNGNVTQSLSHLVRCSIAMLSFTHQRSENYTESHIV